VPPRGASRGALVAAAGACTLAAVVAWRLLASYARDLETVCEAEARSGLAMRRDMAGVGEWARAHLATAQGNRFFMELEDLPVAERARRLDAEARAHGIASCALVAAYGGLVQDGRSRAEMQRICSRVTFPDLPNVTADERAATLERWTEADGAGPQLQALGDGLRAAATHADRARLLVATAHAVDVLTCDNAKDLLLPDPSDASIDAGAD
jgi:hypothetical protein